MTDPATIDPGEELLGRVGIAHALSQSDKAIRVFKNTPELAGQIDACAARFVRGEKPTEPLVIPAFDYDEVLDQLSKLAAPNPDAYRYLDAHLIGAYQVALARAVKYLFGVLPRDSITDMTSTRTVTPSELKLTKFRRIWGVANDITSVFRALESGMLVDDQAIAMQVMFPTAFQALKMALLGEIAEMVGKDQGREKGKPAWTLSYSRDALLQSMLLTSIDDPGALARLQKNFEDAKAAQGAPNSAPPSPRPSKDSLETPIQRASK